MRNRIHVGQWQVWQDSPDFGCTDNPSYNWYANRYVNGHWTGETKGPCVTMEQIMIDVEGHRAAVLAAAVQMRKSLSPEEMKSIERYIETLYVDKAPNT